MEVHADKYKPWADVMKDFEKLKVYGHCTKTGTGEFDHNWCKRCNGPLLGHLVEDNLCVGAILNTAQVNTIMEEFAMNTLFQESVKRIDDHER
jgi:hypothetical protein